MGYDDDRYRNDLRDADLRRDYLRQDYLRADLRMDDVRRGQIDWQNRRDDAADRRRAAEERYERGKELAKSGDVTGLAGLYGLDYQPALTAADREGVIDRFPALTLANIDLFPLNGVTLGRTTIAELNRLGQRSRYVDDQTGEPFRCYQVGGINFWYQDGNVAESVFLSHGTKIPEKWRKHGFSWVHSYDDYGDVLRTLGFEVAVTRRPTTRWFSGRRSFSAELEGHRAGLIGLRVKLDFDFGEGTKAGDIDTLYSIDVAITDQGDGRRFLGQKMLAHDGPDIAKQGRNLSSNQLIDLLGRMLMVTPMRRQILTARQRRSVGLRRFATRPSLRRLPWGCCGRLSDGPSEMGVWEDQLFLDSCDQRIASLYRYWTAKRAGRGMPSRGDIDPIEMKQWLGRIALIDVAEEPDGLRWRLVGSELTIEAGTDLTGRRVDEASYLGDSSVAYSALTDFAAGGVPRYRNDPLTAASGWFRITERLYLPLSSDGNRVDMILLYALNDILVDPYDRRP